MRPYACHARRSRSAADAHAVRPSTPAPVQTGGRRRLYVVLLGLAATVLLLDQATKVWALSALTPGDPVKLVGSLIDFNLIRNPGAAFSIGDRRTWVLTRGRLGVVLGSSSRPTVGNRAVGLGLRPPPRGALATSSTGSSASPGPVSAGTSSTSSTTTPGSSATSPTSPSSPPAVLIALLALRGTGIDGRSEKEPRPCRVTSRAVLVPEGLEGERVDAAIARLFGLSRTRAAEIAAAGDVLVAPRGWWASPTGSAPVTSSR